MGAAPTADQAIVLYDEDCGLCRWTMAKLLAWDRSRRLRPLAIQSGEGRRLLDGLNEEEMLASWHVVREGRRYSAGAGFPPLLGLLPGGAPLARLSAAMPRLSERGYAFVARHRAALGRLIPQSAKRRADQRISSSVRRSSPSPAPRPRT
jgi:predicted DCC family thiol-disulfide oxidoreductase YuxK